MSLSMLSSCTLICSSAFCMWCTARERSPTISSRWRKYERSGQTPGCTVVAKGTAATDLTRLTAGTAYTYKAYSTAGCASADELAGDTFTTAVVPGRGGARGQPGSDDAQRPAAVRGQRARRHLVHDRRHAQRPLHGQRDVVEFGTIVVNADQATVDLHALLRHAQAPPDEDAHLVGVAFGKDARLAGVSRLAHLSGPWRRHRSEGSKCSIGDSVAVEAPLGGCPSTPQPTNYQQTVDSYSLQV